MIKVAHCRRASTSRVFSSSRTGDPIVAYALLASQFKISVCAPALEVVKFSEVDIPFDNLDNASARVKKGLV